MINKHKSILFGFIFIVAFLGSWFILKDKVHLFQKSVEFVHAYMHDLVECCPVKAVLLYGCMFISAVVFAIPLIMPISFIGGMLFGCFLGWFLSILFAIIGCLCSFFIIKTWFLPLMSSRYQEITDELKKWIVTKGVIVRLLLLHFLTIVPYIVINTFAVLLGVSAPIFVIIVFLGSSPVLFMYAFLGSKATFLYQTNPYFLIILMCITVSILFVSPHVVMSLKKSK